MPASPIRILLVDDVAALRRLVRFALEDAGGFQVLGEAANGDEAIDLATRTHPDIVLLDLSMPRLDGLEAIPRLRQASPDSRVVVFSGFTADHMGPVADKMGADEYLEKGIPPQELVDHLRHIMDEGADSKRVAAGLIGSEAHTP